MTNVGPPPPEMVDLGDDHHYIKVIADDGTWVGIHEIHRNAKGEWCGGWAPFQSDDAGAARNRRAWTVESLDPLTLSPSLLCGCGSHGFIQSGRWVAA